MLVERNRQGGGKTGLRPARIRMLLVLLLHAQRDVVVDRRQPRHRRTLARLRARLADLQRQHIVDVRRPRRVRQRIGAGQNVQRSVGGDRDR